MRDWLPAVAALLGAVIGGAFSMGGQWLQAHLTTQSERNARQEEREAAHAARRNAFELEQLTDLRDELEALQHHVEDIIAHRSPSDPEPFAVEEATVAVAAVTRSLRVVLDRHVADEVKKYLEAVNGIIDGTEHNTHYPHVRSMTADAVIGARIRAIFGPVGRTGPDHPSRGQGDA